MLSCAQVTVQRHLDQTDRRGMDGRRLRLVRAGQDGEQFRSQLLTSTEKQTPMQILSDSDQHQEKMQQGSLENAGDYRAAPQGT